MMNKSELKSAIATGAYRSGFARPVWYRGRERPASAFFLIFAAALWIDGGRSDQLIFNFGCKDPENAAMAQALADAPDPCRSES